MLQEKEDIRIFLLKGDRFGEQLSFNNAEDDMPAYLLPDFCLEIGFP